MTYSGQLMLVACVATARMLFRQNDRVWADAGPAGAPRRAGDDAHPQRLGRRVRRHRPAVPDAGLPLARAAPGRGRVFIAFAPAQLTDRLYSSFRLDKLRQDSAETQASVQSNRDRVAMMQSGLRIIKDHPLTGVGPDMVIQVYPHYRQPGRGQPAEPAPAQRAAADRGGARPAGARALAVVHRRAGARLHRQAEDDGDPVARRRRRSPRSWRCWRPGCSNTTSATPSS